jgi:imidazolonepropionase-like amidohydrolase
VAGPGDARHVVDSLKAEGATFIKTYHLDAATYFAIAAEARKIGIPFGGHLTAASAAEASDSGATFIDHLNTSGTGEASVFRLCVDTGATVEECQRLAETFRRNDTWFVPTLTISALTRLSQWSHHRPTSDTIFARLEAFASDFWAGSARSLDFQWSPVDTAGLAGAFSHELSRADSRTAGLTLGIMRLIHRVGLPILAGTDDNAGSMGALPPGFTLDAELAMYVAEGLTPLEALRTATLNPARALHATDSLGTVAPGKLADLVLLDANPLANIDNLTKIRAVVANGRYFDRAALDQLLSGVH